jgi:hypothetical protein
MSDSMNKDEERIIQKIRKLFALAANDGATGNESENALRMANALLAKHSIEKHRLHDPDQVFASFCDYPISQDWVKQVVGTIARFYNCRPIFDYNWQPAKTLVIGTTSNRLTAMIVIDQLLDQIKRDSRGKGIAFKNGAAFGLYETCKKIMDARNAETGNDEVIPGTGLTIIDIEKQQKIDVDAFINSNFKHLTSSRRRAKSVSAEGRAYGQGLNPGARVTGAGQKRLS